jgi:hypothetical protein
MKEIYKNQRVTILAGYKYLYVRGLYPLNLVKVPITEHFNKKTDWNAMWNTDTTYLNAFLNNYMYCQGTLV